MCPVCEHDARPVGLARSRSDMKMFIARRIAAGRHEDADRGRARRAVRRGSARGAAEARLRPARVAAAARRPARRRVPIVGWAAWRWTQRASPARPARRPPQARPGRRAPGRQRARALRRLVGAWPARSPSRSSRASSRSRACVLPLVPGYLSAVSAVEAGQLGERGTARRVALSSVPFIAGFTRVFVAARRRSRPRSAASSTPETRTRSPASCSS